MKSVYTEDVVNTLVPNMLIKPLSKSNLNLWEICWRPMSMILSPTKKWNPVFLALPIFCWQRLIYFHQCFDILLSLDGKFQPPISHFIQISHLLQNCLENLIIHYLIAYTTTVSPKFLFALLKKFIKFMEVFFALRH